MPFRKLQSSKNSFRRNYHYFFFKNTRTALLRRAGCLEQWCGQDFEVGEAQGPWGMEVPKRGARADPLVGIRGRSPPPESSQHITDIWLPNYAQFCVFSNTKISTFDATRCQILRLRCAKLLRIFGCQTMHNFAYFILLILK